MPSVVGAGPEDARPSSAEHPEAPARSVPSTSRAVMRHGVGGDLPGHEPGPGSWPPTPPLPHQLEAVHVHQPAVGDLQVRDHGQGQERELEERPPPAGSPCAATAARRSTSRSADLPEAGGRTSGPRAGGRSSASTLPPPTATKPPSSSIRRFTARAMSASLAPTTQTLWLSWPTLRGERPVPEAEAAHEAAADVAVRPVAGEHRRS